MTASIFRVALSGGIASGKTTVADMFGGLGAMLIDTDIIAREVVEPGTEGLRLVADLFGKSILDSGGALDRRALRHVIFADKKKRRQLEAILHPIIREEAERQMQTLSGDYQVIVIPLLPGSPLKDRVDRILVVDCSEDIQLKRLLARDTETAGQARRIIAAQSGREERLALADDVIRNNAGISDTRDQVAKLHEQYLSFAASN